MSLTNALVLICVLFSVLVVVRSGGYEVPHMLLWSLVPFLWSADDVLAKATVCNFHQFSRTLRQIQNGDVVVKSQL